tara:strand:- start:381 stop:608 length:228 start_codon:yes stop_codon:yes gene_type:complete
MNCVNFTNYIDTINNVCGEDVVLVMDNCNAYCLLSLVHLLNNCLTFLTNMPNQLDKELENIVEFCFNKNYNGNGA